MRIVTYRRATLRLDFAHNVWEIAVGACWAHPTQGIYLSVGPFHLAILIAEAKQ
jgi:hypothetical protein